MLYNVLLVSGFEEAIEFLLWPLCIIIFAVVFLTGSYISRFVNRIVKYLADSTPLQYKKLNVDLITKGCIALIAVIAGIIFHPSIDAVFESVIPVGSFNSIADEFTNNEGKWVINIFFNTLLSQFFLSFLYFVPFLGLQLIISLVETIICENNSAKNITTSTISFALEIVTLISVNTLVLCTGDTFPMMMARFLLSFDTERRIGVIIFLALIFIFIVYYVIRDLFNSDILLGILSVNLSSAFFGIEMTDKNRWILFALAVLLGLISKLIRTLIIKSDSPKTDRKNVIFGIISLCAASILVAIGLEITLRYLPAL